MCAVGLFSDIVVHIRHIGAVQVVMLLDFGHQNAGFVFVSVVRHAQLEPGPRIYSHAISYKNIGQCNFFRQGVEGNTEPCKAECRNECKLYNAMIVM